MKPENQNLRSEEQSAVISAKKSSKLKYILVSVISIVLTVAIVFGIITITDDSYQSRHKTAMEVDGIKISVSEFNFYFMSYVNTTLSTYSSYFTSLGFDLSKSFSDQMVNETTTLADFFIEQSKDYVNQIIVLAERARSEGMTVSEENQEKIENQIENLSSGAEEEGISLKSFIEDNYGTGANEKLIRKAMERFYLADQYQKDAVSKIEFNDEVYNDIYNDNRDQIDTIDVRSTFISAGYGEDATEEEIAASMAEAKIKADELVSRITDESSFHELATEYASESEAEKFENDSYTLSKGMYKAAFNEDATFTDWLFDSSRQPGDKTAMEYKNGYYVFYMISPVSRAEYNSVSCRNILIAPESDSDGTITEEAVQAAKERAESILETYKSGEQTEEAFAELAVVNSQDSLSAANGGLYEQMGKDDFSEGLIDWMYADGRKAGDVEMLAMEDGSFEILYYCGEDMPYWQVQAKAIMESNTISELITDAVENSSVEFNDKGMEKVSEIISEFI